MGSHLVDLATTEGVVTHMDTNLLCIWCNEPLNKAKLKDWPYRQIWVCRCGVEYIQAIIKQADPAEWERIRKRDGYTVGRDKDGLRVTRKYEREVEQQLG